MADLQMLRMRPFGNVQCVIILILVGTLSVASVTLRAHGCIFSMVPVLAVGFDDLRQRVDGQSKQAAEQQKGLMVCSFL